MTVSRQGAETRRERRFPSRRGRKGSPPDRKAMLFQLPCDRKNSQSLRLRVSAGENQKEVSCGGTGTQRERGFSLAPRALKKPSDRKAVLFLSPRDGKNSKSLRLSVSAGDNQKEVSRQGTATRRREGFPSRRGQKGKIPCSKDGFGCYPVTGETQKLSVSAGGNEKNVSAVNSLKFHI